MLFEKQLTEIRNGKNLDQYINDDSIIIRAEVARQGYGLEKLSKDKNPFVRDEAILQYHRKNLVVNK